MKLISINKEEVHHPVELGSLFLGLSTGVAFMIILHAIYNILMGGEANE